MCDTWNGTRSRRLEAGDEAKQTTARNTCALLNARSPAAASIAACSSISAMLVVASSTDCKKTTTHAAASPESIDIECDNNIMNNHHRSKRLKQSADLSDCNGGTSSKENGGGDDHGEQEPVNDHGHEDDEQQHDVDEEDHESGDQGDEDDSEFIDEDDDDDEEEDNGESDEDEADMDDPDGEEEAEQSAGDNGLFDNPEIIPPDCTTDDAQSKKVKFSKPKLFKNAHNQSKRLIVILEKANLEIIKIGKKFELLNCDDHMSQIRKYRKDPAFCRPDIVHQCLLMLFDSPLNRAGLLQVYVHTMNNILIEINPQTRLPRTFPRFAGMMVQLLYNMSIKSNVPGVDKLLRVIKNPVTSHLPVGVRKIGFSFTADRIIRPEELIPDPESQQPLVVVIGAMAHGDINADYVEESVSISNYPLSGALACTKLVSAFEAAWKIH